MLKCSAHVVLECIRPLPLGTSIPPRPRIVSPTVVFADVSNHECVTVALRTQAMNNLPAPAPLGSTHSAPAILPVGEAAGMTASSVVTTGGSGGGGSWPHYDPQVSSKPVYKSWDAINVVDAYPHVQPNSGGVTSTALLARAMSIVAGNAWSAPGASPSLGPVACAAAKLNIRTMREVTTRAL